MPTFNYFHVSLATADKCVSVPGCTVWYYLPEVKEPVTGADGEPRPAKAVSAMAASTADKLTDGEHVGAVERKDPVPKPPPPPPEVFSRSAYLNDPAVVAFFAAEDRSLVGAPTAELLGAHALVIGVSTYRHVRALPPTRDAAKVAELLRDPTRGGYAPDQVVVLEEEQATKQNILRALDDLARRASSSSRVLVYFSGHGGSTRAESYLVPVDGAWASEGELSSLVSSKELNERLGRIAAEQVTVVLDCCRAAGAADAVPRELGDDAVLDSRLLEARLGALARGKGRAVLAASVAAGNAYVLRGAEHGIFTRHLLEGLRGAAHRAGGVIRVLDLYTYTRERVVAEMPAQRPVLKAELEENYAIARCPGAATPPLPAPTDGYQYDAFISYEDAQRRWVRSTLIPHLQRHGLTVATELDFRLGRAWVDEAAHVIQKSRYTVGVITPEYLASPHEKFQAALARTLAAEEERARFVPIMFGARTLPDLGIRFVGALDLTREDDELVAGLDRLAVQLRDAPPSLTGSA